MIKIFPPYQLRRDKSTSKYIGSAGTLIEEKKNEKKWPQIFYRIAGPI